MLKLSFTTEKLEKVKTDIIVCTAFQLEVHGVTTHPLAKLLGQKFVRAVKEQRFSGKEKEVIGFDLSENFRAQKIIIMGLGEAKKFSLDKVRMVCAKAVKKVKHLKYYSLAMLAIDNLSQLEQTSFLYAHYEGAIIAGYNFNGLHKADKKSADDSRNLEQFSLILDGAIPEAKLKKLLTKALVVQEALKLAKDLVNLPANIVTPTYLANTALKLARATKKLKVKILSLAQAQALGLGGFCAVAKGSREPAKFIVLEYRAGGQGKIYGLVGKGITFDSGGISIKPAAGMGEMKTDMSGAATVLATMQALAQLTIKKNILAVIPATENMPDGGAYKPADIIKMYNGLNIEINSTDAEGRMILADALTYIQKMGAVKVIDYATLTGACLIALGQTRTGVMTNSEKFWESYNQAAEQAGEKNWQLPLDEEYGDLLKSEVADALNNSKSRNAGTVSAGKFLEKFINPETQWIHCDIAGTAYLSEPQRYLDKQATGVGIRTLVEYFSRF